MEASEPKLSVPTRIDTSQVQHSQKKTDGAEDRDEDEDEDGGCGNDENEENDDEGFGMYIHESIYACRPTLQNGSRAGLGKNQKIAGNNSSTLYQLVAARCIKRPAIG